MTPAVFTLLQVYVAMWHYFSCASQRLQLQRQTAWCVLMYSPSTVTMTFSCHIKNAMSMKHTLMLLKWCV